MSDDVIEAFLKEMRENHSAEIDSVALPEGTAEYVSRKMAEGDLETLLFMLRLGYLMGLQTGFAVAQGGGEIAEGRWPGPLQA